jgi:hypothetical protein
MSVLGELWGDRAVQAPFGAIACSRDDGRSTIAGTILSPMCKSNTWERWRGTMILIPNLIEIANLKEMRVQRLDQMLCTFLGQDNDEERKFWRKTWSV